MVRRFAAPLIGGALLFAGFVAASPSARAAQNSCIMPTTGTVSGLTLVQDINACNGSVLSLFSGATTPAPPTIGMLWYNTGSGQIAEYDGASWNAIWAVDATNHLTAVQIGGGVQAAVASATITDLWSTASSSVSVTGTTAITQFANGDAVPGTLKVVTFTGITTLTQGGGAGGSPLNLPNNGANITTAPGDYAVVLALSTTNTQVVQYQRATGAALSAVGLAIGSASLVSSAVGSYESPINMQVVATPSGGQLTVAIKGVNGNDPSPTNPVLVGFRSQTPGSGINVFGSQQAPLSLTLATTSSLGCTNGVLCRLWGELICQTESSGICTSILLGLSTQSSSGQCFPLLENILQSTGSGTFGGTNAGVIYTSVSSLSSKAARIAFFIEATWAGGVSGWSSVSAVQLFGPGVKKPCDTVQSVQFTSNTPSWMMQSGINLLRASWSSYVSEGLGSTGPFLFTSSFQVNSLPVIAQTCEQYIGTSMTMSCTFGRSNILFSPATTSISISHTITGSTGTPTIFSPFIVLDEIMG